MRLWFVGFFVSAFKSIILQGLHVPNEYNEKKKKDWADSHSHLLRPCSRRKWICSFPLPYISFGQGLHDGESINCLQYLLTLSVPNIRVDRPSE